jgi:DUF4097 and DUF4098 domain-containing protein YvlB
LLAFLLLACGSIAARTFDDVFDRTYALGAGGAFSLTNVNGSVWIEAWDRPRVHVRAVKSARGNPQELARAQIEVSATPAAVAVETRYPKDEGVEVTVDYRIRVPRSAQLTLVQTVNGNLLVRGVEGPADVRTVNGDVFLSDAHGRIAARTTNGTVQMELHSLRLAGPVDLSAMNGLVVVAVPDDFNATLEISSVNGDFQSALPVQVQGSMAAREFRATLGRGGHPLRIRTVNGSIRVLEVQPTA